jgi:hypothetical protein
MSGFGGITVPNLTPPQAPTSGNTTDELNFEQQMFQYATEVSAITTAINTVGNALKDAASKVPQ